MRRCTGLLGLLLIPGALAAQYPGQDVEAPYARVRSLYVAQMYAEILPVLSAWRERIEKGDPRALASLIEADALISPAEGWIARDRKEAMDSLVTRLSTIRGYIVKPYDFTASGNLAYVFGRLGYSIAGVSGAPTREVRGTFTMVLFLRGKNWKVRAYIEREGEP